MTIQHFTAETVDAWFRTPECREAFIAWVTASPLAVRRASNYLIGYAADDLIQQVRTDRQPFVDWLLELPHDHPAVRWLWDCMSDDWIGTNSEHDAFHAIYGDDALCCGCWI